MRFVQARARLFVRALSCAVCDAFLQEIDEEGDSIFERYQLGFGNEEFGDEDADGDIHFDEQDGNAGAA